MSSREYYGADLAEAYPDAQGPSFRIEEYLQLVARRWRLVAAICLLTTAAGLLHFFITPPLYRASTSLQIEQRSFLPFDGGRNPWLEAWASMKYYPTQYRLLTSRGLAERVVLNLDLVHDPKFNPGSRPAGGQETIEPAEEVDETTVARLANRVLSGLEVKPVKDTELVTVTYTSSSPEMAARIANAVAEAFIDWGIETRSETVGRASTFLSAQIEALKDEIQEKERQLQQYSRSTDLVTLDPGSNASLQKLERLNSEVATALGERLEKEARWRELSATPLETIADQETGGLVGEMRSELIRLRREYETKLKVYKTEWPEMRELKARIDEGEEHLTKVVSEQVEQSRQAAYAEYQTALRRERALESEIQKAKVEAIDLGQVAVEYNNLQMEIRTRRDLLDELLRQLSEAGLSARLSGTRQTNVRVVDKALMPGAPFRPSLRNDLLTGLAAGLVLGVALIFFVHFLDRTIKTGDELERLLNLPVLSVIPDIDGGPRGYGYRSYAERRSSALSGPRGRLQRIRGIRKGSGEGLAIELLPEKRPRLAVSESYRSLRTALLLSSAEQLKVVTVTSAEAGEGKTATAVNLAVVMAQLGRSVLLVDADLRKPRLHQILELSNRTGLVNFLTGSADADAVFLASGVANLHLCPAGPHPPNPSELLSSERMTELMRLARSRFDFVIVDSPPVLAVTDAIIAGSISDGVVLCFRAHKVLREDVVSCRDRLLLAEVKILGAVLNRYHPRTGGSYDRRYYYYYQAYSDSVDEAASDSAA